MRARRLYLAVSLAALLCAQPALAADSPKLDKTALVNTVSGKVRVKEKGKSGFEPLSGQPTLVRLGSVIDAKRGKVRVRTDTGKRRLSEGVFWKGDFEVRQDRDDEGVVTQLVLQGEVGGGGCAAAQRGASRGSSSVPRLWGESGDRFRTLGYYASAEVEEPETRWLTEDLCDGTRTFVKSGGVRASGSGVLIISIDERQTVQHICDFDGDGNVSRAFCTMVTHAPDLGVYGAGITTAGEATSYDLCVTNPAGAERCTTYQLSEPFGSQGLRESVISCSADSGPGSYSVRWLVSGVQLGPSLGFTIDAPPGQDCISRP